MQTNRQRLVDCRLSRNSAVQRATLASTSTATTKRTEEVLSLWCSAVTREATALMCSGSVGWPSWAIGSGWARLWFPAKVNKEREREKILSFCWYSTVGYSHPDDPYVLAGSCGVEYSLSLTAKGKQHFNSKKSSSWWGGGGNSRRSSSSYSYWRKESAWRSSLGLDGRLDLHWGDH